MVAPLTPRRADLAVLFLLLAAGLLLALLRAGSGAALPAGDLGRLPLRIGEWEGDELEVSARDRAILGTDNLILRRYRRGEDSLYLYVLESSSNRASFHPPEYCYIGGRTEMVERGRVIIPGGEGGIPAHRFVFLGPRGRSLVYYWYTFGERFLTDYYRQQLMIIAAVLLRRTQPALLVRISMEGSFDLETADGQIADFAAAVLPAIQNYLRGSVANTF